jgi:hypothetical protein
MNALSFGRPTLAFCALTLALTGCGGTQPPVTAGAMPQIRTTALHPDRRPSWMVRPANSKFLLYISDIGTGDVDIFSYPNGKQVGALTGFNGNQGECTDSSGDVYVVAASAVYEFNHGGKTPIKTLTNPGYLTDGCAVDPTTGNLAVTSFCAGTPASGCTGEGVLSIYTDAVGTPTQYMDPKISFYAFCGYDATGNLWLDGYNEVSSQMVSQFAELPAAKSTFKNITLQNPLVYPGGVQWDGTYVAVGDQTQQVIYQTKGTKGKIDGSTPLLDSAKVAQFWIQGKNVIAPDVNDANVKFYKYPAGGYPTKTISGLDEPVGAVVSVR